jgi:hypothetical protein
MMMVSLPKLSLVVSRFPKRRRPPAERNASMNSLLTRVSGGWIALALVASAMGAARAGEVTLTGRLHAVDPARTDTGLVTYHSTADRATLSVAVQNVLRADTVDVFVNGNFIGTIALDVSGEFGSGKLDLDTANGDDVPTLQEDDEIEVFDGRLPILSGQVHAPDTVVLFGALVPPDFHGGVGQVNYEMRSDRTTLSVAVTHVNSAAALDVFANGDFIGTIFLDPRSGNGELDLDTANGDIVPTLQAGDEIDVFDPADDTTLLLMGRLRSRD